MITNVPNEITVHASEGYWFTENYRVGSDIYLTQCTSETWGQSQIDYCQEFPYDSSCQPVVPTIPGEFDFPSGGGSGGGQQSGSPIVEFTVSRCNYRMRKDASGNTIYRISEVMQCHQRFTPEERGILLLGLDSLVRLPNDPSFTNDSARTQCAEMRSWLIAALQDTMRFAKGISNSPDHQWGGEAIIGDSIAHLDPSAFDSIYVANNVYRPLSTHRQYYQRLMSMALHEPAHGWGGKEHLISGNQEPGPNYTTPYFKWVSGWGGENHCVK